METTEIKDRSSVTNCNLKSLVKDDQKTPDELYEELIATIKKYHPSDDLSLVEKAYKLARENEIRMARIILTAKANGLPDTAIRERARKMYV